MPITSITHLFSLSLKSYCNHHHPIYVAYNGTPLQYSCLENPMDGGAWWATVHGVSKSWTRLSDFTSLHRFLGFFNSCTTVLTQAQQSFPINANGFSPPPICTLQSSELK